MCLSSVCTSDRAPKSYSPAQTLEESSFVFGHQHVGKKGNILTYQEERSGQTVVLQLLWPSRDAMQPKRLFPIYLHGERDFCNSLELFLSIQTATK